MTKNEARIYGKNARKSVVDRAYKNRLIFDRLFEVLSELSYSRPLVYLSLKSEVDTKHIVDKLFELNKTVLAPKVVGEDMIAVRISVDDVYENSVLGVKEPLGNDNMTPDIVILPLVAFDEICNRVGFGKGYYDRFLASLDNGALKIALAYEEQKVDSIMAEDFDIPCDLIITDKKVYGELK